MLSIEPRALGMIHLMDRHKARSKRPPTHTCFFWLSLVHSLGSYNCLDLLSQVTTNVACTLNLDSYLVDESGRQQGWRFGSCDSQFVFSQIITAADIVRTLPDEPVRKEKEEDTEDGGGNGTREGGRPGRRNSETSVPAGKTVLLGTAVLAVPWKHCFKVFSEWLLSAHSLLPPHSKAFTISQPYPLGKE